MADDDGEFGCLMWLLGFAVVKFVFWVGVIYALVRFVKWAWGG